ncbi:phenylacetic acid degradation protein [Desulfolithobacter dissulfuricans]|uniref:Phenylacetic acid degradation protein n=1 Tax=Desulfolithobacter dissulfuricans TaxID=2795293 RepID=A0A915U306_9BACT|nr:PaaI family thioesterase [Desulfolithobacter dissulfuricans]BCO10424.1 phenylacetic acid degradation protein [Desulfolithobacter dissulfuricans]
MDLQTFFQKDSFARYVGIELLDVAPGYARVQLDISSHHLNGVNIAHGGAIFALADYAFAVASNSHGTVALGINATISYLKAAGEGLLTAEAKEISRNPKLATYQVSIADADRNLIAVFQGTVYRKKDKIANR